ncbi:MAG: SPOR domain-containing protein [Deltaproteobacteria bacterium]|nr:SPOR domain-containing protein [Deltaproteobacteria bacterium]
MAGKKKPRQNKESKIYRIECTRLSLTLWVFGFLFGLFWIFIFGILVGRGFLPEMLTDVSDIRSQLSAIRDMMSREKSDETGLSSESETDLKMGFYKSLSGKKDDEIEAWAPKERVAIPKREASVTRTQPQDENPETNRVETRVTVFQKERPDSKLPKMTEAQYTVQLASLGEEGKAHEMVENLEKSGFPAFINEREVMGRTYYRVNCGVFTRKEAAENHAEALFKKKGISGLVMRLSVDDD